LDSSGSGTERDERRIEILRGRGEMSRLGARFLKGALPRVPGRSVFRSGDEVLKRKISGDSAVSDRLKGRNNETRTVIVEELPEAKSAIADLFTRATLASQYENLAPVKAE